jgi:transposase
MAPNTSRLTRKQMESRRLEAARLLGAGKLTQAEIARQLGVTRMTVSRWSRLLQQGGALALRRRHGAGRRASLTPAQWKQVERLLDQEPRDAGFAADLWTKELMQQLVEREFGVRYHPDHIARVLRYLD